MLIYAVDVAAVPPLTMPDRFRLEIVYFMTPSGARTAPTRLPEGEYWIDRGDAQQWLDDYVVEVVSPLDAASKAEIELSEDHERFLEWLLQHHVQHVRVG
jgi:hypothetical protein